LKDRAINEKIVKQINYIIKKTEQTAINLGVDMTGAQPSPGNIAGSIATVEEKSLDCINKSGSTPVKHVYDCAQKISHKGLCIMDIPCDDVRSVTGMAAGGCQLVFYYRQGDTGWLSCCTTY